MSYTVIIKTNKNHTSEHEVEATSPDQAIDLVLDTMHSDVHEAWCEDVHEYL
jgi:hypothetical protein